MHGPTLSVFFVCILRDHNLVFLVFIVTKCPWHTTGHIVFKNV